MSALQKLQSAYRRKQSGKKAVTKVFNDLIVIKSRCTDTILV